MSFQRLFGLQSGPRAWLAGRTAAHASLPIQKSDVGCQMSEWLVSCGAICAYRTEVILSSGICPLSSEWAGSSVG